MLKKTVKGQALQESEISGPAFDDDDSAPEVEGKVEPQNARMEDQDTTKSPTFRESTQLVETQVVNDFAFEIYDTLDLPSSMRT